MKIFLFLFCFLIIMQPAFCQSTNINSILPKLATEQNDDARFKMVLDYFSNSSELDPVQNLKNAQILLTFSMAKNDKICEAFAKSMIANAYRSFGNTENALEYFMHSMDLANEIGNQKLIALISQAMGNVYKDMGDYDKAISYYKITEQIGEKLNYEEALTWAYGNLAEAYLKINKIDSAFMYGQRDIEVCTRIHYFDYIGYSYLTQGAINGKMGNNALAISYFDMAIQEGIKIKSPKQLSWAYLEKAQFYYDINQKDSAIVNAKKSLAALQNTSFINYSLKPAKLLLNIYENSNSDSALKYFKIFRIANDSLFSAKNIQQTQLKTFENDIRMKELATEKVRLEEQRHLNIQYALIALGIVTFIILFLLLSHTIIVTEKWISFFGILGLLIVFEFINLLIHPFLENLTHHSPLLMLLSLVLLASLLIPMHNRMEKWINEKMTEKNKNIRLENAKKTLEKLGGTDKS